MPKIEEMIGKIEASDLNIHTKFTFSELYSMAKTKEALEKLRGFYASEYANLTVKELLTSTANISLPTMVQARALLELKNWVDARELCMRVAVPKGAGKTINTQVMTQPTFSEWTEGSALAAADPTLANRSITMKPFGKVTKISDLLANTSAVNFVENLGQIHGACVRQGIFQYVCVALSAGAGGTISAASGSTLQFGDATGAIKAPANLGFQPDFIVTSPSNMWTAFTTSFAVTQFTGALADMLVNGLKPNALGLDWYADPFWDTLFPAAQKVLGYVGKKGLSAIWAALEEDPIVELYRVPTELGNYVITHLDGGAVVGSANSICSITYQS